MVDQLATRELNCKKHFPLFSFFFSSHFRAWKRTRLFWRSVINFFALSLSSRFVEMIEQTCPRSDQRRLIDRGARGERRTDGQLRVKAASKCVMSRLGGSDISRWNYRFDDATRTILDAAENSLKQKQQGVTGKRVKTIKRDNCRLIRSGSKFGDVITKLITGGAWKSRGREGNNCQVY